MASTGKSFDQIKAILGKLDRQVDEARIKRLGITPAPAGAAAAPPAATRLGQAFEAPASPPSERRSKYGRAKPLNRSEEDSNGSSNGNGSGASNGSAWTNGSAPQGDLDETIG